MANGHGGATIGAGGKKKLLADKILEVNSGKRKLTVIEFTYRVDLEGEKMPPPRDYLDKNEEIIQKGGSWFFT